MRTLLLKIRASDTRVYLNSFDALRNKKIIDILDASENFSDASVSNYVLRVFNKNNTLLHEVTNKAIEAKSFNKIQVQISDIALDNSYLEFDIADNNYIYLVISYVD
jgi:hypothetical protein